MHGEPTSSYYDASKDTQTPYAETSLVYHRIPYTGRVKTKHKAKERKIKFYAALECFRTELTRYTKNATDKGLHRISTINDYATSLLATPTIWHDFFMRRSRYEPWFERYMSDMPAETRRVFTDISDLIYSYKQIDRDILDPHDIKRITIRCTAELETLLNELFAHYPWVDPRGMEGHDLVLRNAKNIHYPRNFNGTRHALWHNSQDWSDMKVYIKVKNCIMPYIGKTWVHHTASNGPGALVRALDDVLEASRDVQNVIDITEQYRRNLSDLRKYKKQIIINLLFTAHKEIIRPRLWFDAEESTAESIFIPFEHDIDDFEKDPWGYAKKFLNKAVTREHGKIKGLSYKFNRHDPHLGLSDKIQRTTMAVLPELLKLCITLQDGTSFFIKHILECNRNLKTLRCIRGKLKTASKTYIDYTEEGIVPSPLFTDLRLKAMQADAVSHTEEQSVSMKTCTKRLDEIGHKNFRHSFDLGNIDKAERFLLMRTFVDLQLYAIHKALFAHDSKIVPYQLTGRTLEHIKDPEVFALYCKNCPDYVGPVIQLRDCMLADPGVLSLTVPTPMRIQPPAL